MLKKAVILYGCQIYKAILPLVFTPLILDALGTERYGMIAFFYMLVGVLGLLDAGISGTFLKLVATNRNILCDYKKVTNLFFKVSLVFVFASLCLFLLFFTNHDYIVSSWLNSSIEKSEAIYSIKAIGFILAATYIKSYLTSFINGMEKQEWVTIWSVCYSTAFYFGTFFAVTRIENSLFVFYDVMLILAPLDLLVVLGFVLFIDLRHSRQLKRMNSDGCIIPLARNEEELRFTKILRFSLQLSGLSLIWVVATQIDKFVLSVYIPLSEYAKYQIAVQICTAIAVFSSPLTQILLPRLSDLYAKDERQQYVKIFSIAIFGFVFLLAPVMPYFFIFGDELISLWMNDIKLGASINIYAKWLVSAAFISCVMNFVFICLYTLGQLKKHFYAYALYSCITIPLSIFVAKNYGAIGSAKFVFFHSLLFMLIWGGGQIKEKFSGFVIKFFFFCLFVIILSIFVFKLSSLLIGYDTSLVYKVFIPPLINGSLLTLLLFICRNKFYNFIVSISLVESKG